MQGESMIEKECATEIKVLALKAITELSQVLNVCENRCTEEEYECIRKGVGLSIGKIDTELLGIIYMAYPELDDLS